MENQEHPVYTVAEVAAMLRLSRPTVTRLFEKESGVIMLNRPETMHKRRYRSLRIPRHVYQRVLSRITISS
jgi:AraC-like DNA-binding protein